jgi:hypothetical protein
MLRSPLLLLHACLRPHCRRTGFQRLEVLQPLWGKQVLLLSQGGGEEAAAQGRALRGWGPAAGGRSRDC